MDKQEITERIRQYRQEIDAAKAQWNQEYAASSDEERTAMRDYAEFCAYMEEREVEAIDEEYAEELTGAGDIVRIKPELLDNSELQQMRYMLEEQVGSNEACIRALGTGLSNPPTTIVDMDWVEKAEYPAT